MGKAETIQTCAHHLCTLICGDLLEVYSGAVLIPIIRDKEMTRVNSLTSIR